MIPEQRNALIIANELIRTTRSLRSAITLCSDKLGLGKKDKIDVEMITPILIIIKDEFNISRCPSCGTWMPNGMIMDGICGYCIFVSEE
jgi:hypothetical protein